MGRRAANGEGSLRLRKDGRWEYMVVVGYDALQKPIRKSFYGKGKTEVKRKYREWLQKPANVKIEKVKTVGEWALVWLDTYKKDKVEYGTYKNYEMYVTNHIIPEVGNLKFEQVKPAHLERLMKRKSHLSKSARRHIKIVLSGIFETAIDNNFCTSNPCRKLKIGIDTTKVPEVFTANEITNILKVAPAVPDGHVVELLLYTGLRLGEAAGLQWGDIDTESQIITVRRSIARKEGGGCEVKSTKSGKERYIGINNKLAALLDRIPKNGLYVLSRDSGETPSIYSLGKRYKKALKNINERLSPENNIRELTPHKCRHTYATYLLRGGANLRQVQHLLGHSTVAVTEIYTHVDTDDIKNSVTKLPY